MNARKDRMHLRRLPILFLSLTSACAATAPGQKPEPKSPALTEAQAMELGERVEGFVTAQGYPNFAMGVVRGSELIWETGLGEGPRAGEAPDSDTYFRAGSITKVVTATALLALADEGRLSLDDDAATWLPEVASALSPAGRPAVTLRHLIGHASGIPSIGNGTLDWTKPGADITEADVLAALDGVEPSFTPGTRHDYSNLGMALAGIVVARAGGESYRSFVQERVLDPLGMDASTWDVPAGDLAPGFLPSSRGGYERASGTWRLGAMEPAGGLFTTVRDLAGLASHGLGHGSVLEKGTLAASQTGPDGYGLGWMVSEVPGLGKVVWHNGSTADFGAWLGVLPEHDLAVAILMGSGAVGDMAEIRSLGVATLAWLVDPETDLVPVASTTSAAAIEAVGGRLLALGTAPTAVLVDEAFSALFLAAVPRDELVSFFQGIAAAVGACTSYEVVEDRGAGSILFRIDCAKGDLLADAQAETDAPHRLAGLLIKPAD